jgi:pullulanase
MKSYKLLLLILLFSFNILEGRDLFLGKDYKSISAKKIEPQKVNELDKYYSDKKLGSFVENGKTFFRLFTPSAIKVDLIIFNKPEDQHGIVYEMKRDENGVWEAIAEEELYGKFYGYKVFHNEISEPVLSLDPYAKAVATHNSYGSPRKALIVSDEEFKWDSEKWIRRDWRDLIIYEMHVKDLTAHPSSGAQSPGTYKSLTEKNIRGGIDYIKNLGVNTVELLPVQEFANIEIPYRDSMMGRFNTWNPYERNHWGYMTAAFFAPESYYAENYNVIEWDTWSGQSGSQINEFKEMVNAFHKEGIAVIMDVVYNHLSEYEVGNLKEIDRDYYFRFNDNGDFKSESGCGNDLKTERSMVRRLIIESVLFWMNEYNIDGFRFDLGKLIDWETIEEISVQAKKINPDVIIVCEPWGGGYDPMGFSLRGWGSWNDQIRNGIKGENPFNGQGWIFSKWYGNNDKNRIKSYVNGTLVNDKHGLFQRKEHSVNYLESHDGYTLADFIRIGLNDVDTSSLIKNIDEHVKLTPTQLKLNKLAALFLLTSQGITMIHSGQEFGRSKVIPHKLDVKDSRKGKIDHNSYEKDNLTNYINYDHAEINRELLDYYTGLINLRNTFEAFRRASYESVEFFNTKNDFAIGYKITYNDDLFIVLMNADLKEKESFLLPEGNWEILVNEESAGVRSLDVATKEITVNPSSGVVMKLKR